MKNAPEWGLRSVAFPGECAGVFRQRSGARSHVASLQRMQEEHDSLAALAEVERRTREKEQAVRTPARGTGLRSMQVVELQQNVAHRMLVVLLPVHGVRHDEVMEKQHHTHRPARVEREAT